MRWRAPIQALSLILFVAVLTGVLPVLPADMLVGLDPAVAVVVGLGGRVLAAFLIPGLLVLASSLVLGRSFCGWICPFGATLDAVRWLAGRLRLRPRRPRITPSGRSKHWVLAAVLAAALAGVGLVWWAAPLPLIARFYGLVLAPVAERAADAGLALLAPLAHLPVIRGLYFAEFKPASYATAWLVAAIFAAVFALEMLSPRFWCRAVCPAGALLSLGARVARVRRRVAEGCTACGRCVRACPSGALRGGQPHETAASECLLCGRCAQVCQERVVGFGPRGPAPLPAPLPAPQPSRRAVLTAGAAGLGLAVAFPVASLALPRSRVSGRPPGALPEDQFLARCVRCGACMAACPTNTLQPAWLATGALGLFSPVITPVRGFCDPRCHACAPACPTNAIREVPPEERPWMKTGTAKVIKERCLAWREHKKCLVCDEACPFDAVSLQAVEGNPVRVPVVDEKKCAGCGYCEHHCPVRVDAPAPAGAENVPEAASGKAIIVESKGELRLARGSYPVAARQQGLSLTLQAKPAYAPGEASEEMPADELPLGFDAPEPEGGSEGSGGLPPGFDPL